MTLAQWNNTIAVNLTGSFLLIREFLKQIEAHKVTDNVAIVMIGSTAGRFGEAYHADYAVTKSAMMGGLLLSLKNEIVKTAPRARINVVAPGWVRTPMAERAMQDMNLLYQALARCDTPCKKKKKFFFLKKRVKPPGMLQHSTPQGLRARRYCQCHLVPVEREVGVQHHWPSAHVPRRHGRPSPQHPG